VFQNALIKLLADHYTVDYNVQQDFSLNSLLKFHTSTIQHQKSKTYPSLKEVLNISKTI